MNIRQASDFSVSRHREFFNRISQSFFSNNLPHTNLKCIVVRLHPSRGLRRYIGIEAGGNVFGSILCVFPSSKQTMQPRLQPTQRLSLSACDGVGETANLRQSSRKAIKDNACNRKLIATLAERRGRRDRPRMQEGEEEGEKERRKEGVESKRQKKRDTDSRGMLGSAPITIRAWCGLRSLAPQIAGRDSVMELLTRNDSSAAVAPQSVRASSREMWR